MDDDIFDYEIDEKDNQRKLNDNLLSNESDKISKVNFYT